MAKKRKPVGIAVHCSSSDGGVFHYVVCDDGTSWCLVPGENEWEELALPIPGTEQAAKDDGGDE